MQFQLMDLPILKVACTILIALITSQNTVASGYEVIQDNGCRKVLIHAPNHNLAEKGYLRSSNVGEEVRAEVCGWWSNTTYYCPGDGICCTPGDAESKCCPSDHPLCLPEGCCPKGYPKICGRYCCEENSFCCNGENCCCNEEECCGENQSYLEEAPSCEDGESKTSCDKNVQACCEGYGCVDPCESQFDALGCQLSALSLSSVDVESRFCTFGRRLFRILRPNENPAIGIVAKDPLAKKTVLSHVNCGSRPKYTSQYISATASLDVAKHYKAVGEKKGLTRLRIAEVQLDNLPKHCRLEIVDLTSEENRDHYLGKAVCKNFAKASCEVLLKCDVPIPCEVIDPTEEKKSLKDFGEL